MRTKKRHCLLSRNFLFVADNKIGHQVKSFVFNELFIEDKALFFVYAIGEPKSVLARRVARDSLLLTEKLCCKFWGNSIICVKIKETEEKLYDG